MNGDADRQCIVHWWKYRTGGYVALNKARQKGHPIILSPNSFMYLSCPVKPNANFPPERTSDFRKVYTAQWLPPDDPADVWKNVLGAECCVWTEHLTADMLDGRVFPRILAVAELMWNYPEKRDYDRFRKRVETQTPYWRELGVEYGEYEDCTSSASSRLPV